jgi:hypothetical protein
MSISTTFYEQLFRARVICKAFHFLKFGFVIFCGKNINTKADRKNYASDSNLLAWYVLGTSLMFRIKHPPQKNC